MTKPLSPLYFIKENKGKCSVLIFLVILTYAAYLGGLYITNPADNFQYSFDMYDNITDFNLYYQDTDAGNFENLSKEIKENKDVEFIQMGNYNYLCMYSIMGFNMSGSQFTFTSQDDFKTFNKQMKIVDQDFELNDGEVILSEKFAKNIGFTVGDVISLDSDNNELEGWLSKDYTVAALTKEDGYIAYFMDEGSVNTYFLMLNKSMSQNEFTDYSGQLYDKYNSTVYICTKESYTERINEDFVPLYFCYAFVIFFMALVLALTINAAFVGVYQKRHFEFAVYRGMGISKGRLARKIIFEILLLDLIGLIIGGVIFFIFLYLFNNLVLYDAGKYLCYFNPIALLGLILCNIIILVPLILTRCKELLKADICEY